MPADTNTGDNRDPAEDHDSFRLDSVWNAMGSSCDVESDDPLLGHEFGGVVLVRAIGEGGMGRIYEARQHSPARLVAVKVMRPGLFSPGNLKRFLRESQILARLQHPAVAQIFSAGSFQVTGTPVPYFVMELIPDARPITQYASESSLSIDDRVDLFRQVCEAVGHGHLQGIIHRDIKPGNVLVDPGGHPKVIDFGVARWGEADGSMSALTTADQLIGSVAYMSPEQFAGDSTAIGVGSDIHALGIMLYELLTGRPPYDVGRKPIAAAARIIQEYEPVRADHVDARVPSGLADVAARCLAKQPADRFGNVAELIKALDSCSREPSIAWWQRPRRHFFRSAPGDSIKVWRRRGLVTGLAATAAVAALSLRGVTGRSNASSQTWHYGFRTVLQADADRWLVESTGMRKWEESFTQPTVSYWGPAANDVEGRLVYRFDFPAASHRIHLRLVLSCFAALDDPNVQGRGASAIEISGDGVLWVSLGDHLEPPRWGTDCFIDTDLPDEVLGTPHLWLRMRFLMEDSPAPAGYAVAQFGRSSSAAEEEVFTIEADCPRGATARDGRQESVHPIR